jgi:hypothetical protein
MRTLTAVLVGLTLLSAAAGADEAFSSAPQQLPALEQELAGSEAWIDQGIDEASAPTFTPAPSPRAGCVEGSTVSFLEGCCYTTPRTRLYLVFQCTGGTLVYLRTECRTTTLNCIPR